MYHMNLPERSYSVGSARTNAAAAAHHVQIHNGAADEIGTCPGFAREGMRLGVLEQ